MAKVKATETTKAVENAEVTETAEQPQEVVMEADGVQEILSYDIGSYLYRTDLESRIYYLDDAVTEYTFREVTMLIAKANRDDINLEVSERIPIKLIINTPGGSVLDGLALIDAIQTSITPVIGIVMGTCFSMGLPIICSCPVRLAMPNSTFLFHDGFTGLSDSSNKFMDAVRFYLKIDKKINKIIADNSNLTMKKLEKIKRAENYWFAKKAKKLGIIDYIIGTDIDLGSILSAGAIELSDECECDECHCEDS